MRTCRIDRMPKCSYATEEALNSLSTNLTFVGKEYKKIMITSTQSGEGKSFVSFMLMNNLAGLGYRVALVDADMRRSRLRSRYSIQFEEGKDQGLSHYLAGLAELDEVVYQTNYDNVVMVPAGREVTNSLQLLNSSRFGVLVNALAREFDCVFVDAPPVGVIIDAAQIAKSCDGVLVVARYNGVTTKSLKETCAQIKSSGCPILGTVLNEVDTGTLDTQYYYRKRYYYHYDGRYAYRSDNKSDSGAKKPKGLLGLFKRK